MNDGSDIYHCIAVYQPSFSAIMSLKIGNGWFAVRDAGGWSLQLSVQTKNEERHIFQVPVGMEAIEATDPKDATVFQ
jgi:hypothetical protein